MRIGLFTDTYPPFINGVSTSVLMLKKGLEKEDLQVKEKLMYTKIIILFLLQLLKKFGLEELQLI